MPAREDQSVDLGSRHLRAAKAAGVLRVVLDRPERRNACTVEMYHGIKKAAVLAERDPDVDVLVLTGAGDHFCVGGEMRPKRQERRIDDRSRDRRHLPDAVRAARALPEARARRDQWHVPGRWPGDDADERPRRGLGSRHVSRPRAAPRRRRLLPRRAPREPCRRSPRQVAAVHGPALLAPRRSRRSRVARRAAVASTTPSRSPSAGFARPAPARGRP